MSKKKRRANNVDLEPMGSRRQIGKNEQKICPSCKDPGAEFSSKRAPYCITCTVSKGRALRAERKAAAEFFRVI